MRLFAALFLPKPSLDALDGWSASAFAGVRGVRRVSRDNLHLTLRFFGEFDPAEAIRVIEKAWRVCGSPPLGYELCETGTFDGRVIWVGGAVSPGVADLARAMGNRAFKPHVTVARLEAGGGPCFPLPPLGLSGSFDCMALVRSTLTPGGPVYEPVHVWRQGGLP